MASRLETNTAAGSPRQRARMRLGAAELARRRQMCAAANNSRAAAAAGAEAAWIADLGDLYRYSPVVRPHWLLAAQLRRDNPALTYRQLAEAMGVTKDSYIAMIRRFRATVAAVQAAAKTSNMTVRQHYSQTPPSAASGQECLICGDLACEPVPLDGGVACAAHTDTCAICTAAVVPGETACGPCQQLTFPSVGAAAEAVPA